MHCKQWIFDMDGTLTDSMTVVWEGAPDALLRRYGRTPRGDLRATLLNMGMQEGAQYLIREYGLPLTEESYFSVMREVIAELYETVELKPGVRTMLAKLQAEGARMCICSNTWAEQCRTVLTRLIRRRHRPQGRVLRHWHCRPHLCRRRAGDAPHLQPVRAPVGCAGLDTCVRKKGRSVRFFSLSDPSLLLHFVRKKSMIL